ncbi:aconitate hydratase, cytoplasmic, partial [Tanacetum coccineum]
MRHEFDNCPKKIIRDIRSWDWFLEEYKQNSDEDEDEVSNKKQKRKKDERGRKVERTMTRMTMCGRAGTMIPIDEVVLEGNCEVNEKPLTDPGPSFSLNLFTYGFAFGNNDQNATLLWMPNPVRRDTTVVREAFDINMFVDYNESQQERVYSSYLELDLLEVEPCPSVFAKLSTMFSFGRPHDRVTLKDIKQDRNSCLDSKVGFQGFEVPKEAHDKVAKFDFHGQLELPHFVGFICYTLMTIPFGLFVAEEGVELRFELGPLGVVLLLLVVLPFVGFEFALFAER